MKIFASLLIGSTVLASPVYAEMCHGSVAHHSMTVQDKKLAKLPQVAAYMKANAVMHKGMNIRYTGDSDVDFVEGMIPHHQGAVDMALVQLQYGKDEELKTLAHRIIIAQEAEIGMMNAWINGRRSAWTAENVDELESVIAYKEGMAIMHKEMDIKFSGDADNDFARGMIPHHQGAIVMAEVLKKHGRDPMLRDLADDIIRSQAQEIRQMQDWLAAHPVAEKPVVKTTKKKTKKNDHTHH